MILLRHAESHFNVVYKVTRKDPGFVDPGLTEEGVRQAKDVGEALSGREIRRVIASPYSRTLETAEIIADRIGLPVCVDPLVGERACFACDIGSPRAQLARRWPEFEFGALGERWWPELEETEAGLLERCARFRREAALAVDRRYLLVVTHWGFIRGLTGQEVANATILTFDPRGDPTSE